jgi:hypothetical protein
MSEQTCFASENDAMADNPNSRIPGGPEARRPGGVVYSYATSKWNCWMMRDFHH